MRAVMPVPGSMTSLQVTPMSVSRAALSMSMLWLKQQCSTKGVADDLRLHAGRPACTLSTKQPSPNTFFSSLMYVQKPANGNWCQTVHTV
jgi:hypothetical protein